MKTEAEIHQKAQVPSNVQSPVYTFKYHSPVKGLRQITGLELVFYVHDWVGFFFSFGHTMWHMGSY